MCNLKPCPFCGREVEIRQVAQQHDIYVIKHKELEPICYLWHNNGYQGKESDLVELWNRRV